MPLVALPCQSRSTTSTRLPSFAASAATFVVVVVFAEPPLNIMTATILGFVKTVTDLFLYLALSEQASYADSREGAVETRQVGLLPPAIVVNLQHLDAAVPGQALHRQQVAAEDVEQHRREVVPQAVDVLVLDAGAVEGLTHDEPDGPDGDALRAAGVVQVRQQRAGGEARRRQVAAQAGDGLRVQVDEVLVVAALAEHQ